MQSLGVGQLHWAPPLGWQEQAYWKGLAELRAAGRVREVGLSNYGPKGVTRAHRFLAGLDTPLASNQVKPLDIATFSTLFVLGGTRGFWCGKHPGACLFERCAAR